MPVPKHNSTIDQPTDGFDNDDNCKISLCSPLVRTDRWQAQELMASFSKLDWYHRRFRWWVKFFMWNFLFFSSCAWKISQNRWTKMVLSNQWIAFYVIHLTVKLFCNRAYLTVSSHLATRILIAQTHTHTQSDRQTDRRKRIVAVHFRLFKFSCCCFCCSLLFFNLALLIYVFYLFCVCLLP